MVTKSIYISSGGGLGDVIYTYFIKKKWKFVETVRQQFPDITIVSLLTSHCSSAHELIELNPNIDAIIKCKWYPPKHAKEYYWKDFVSPGYAKNIEHFASEKGLAPADNIQLYLTPEEEKQAHNILIKPTIVLHPFAGLRYRSCLPSPKDGRYQSFPDYKYPELCQQLTSRGFQVVLLGKSEPRPGPRHMHEILDINGSNIINLCNKASTRLSVKLCRNANGFIGNHSSMLSAAWTSRVPSVFFYPKLDPFDKPLSVKKNGGETGTWALHKPWNGYYEMTGEQFKNLKPSDVVDKLEKFITRRQ